MNKSKGVKATSQFVGLLLCMILIQTALATENQNQFFVNFPNNSTLENETIDNSTMENVTIENMIIDDSGNIGIVYDSDNDTIVDPSYYYTYIVEGSSTQFSVSFINNGNETLVLTPKVIATSNANNINESWITISPANATVAPGSVQYFTIEVNVPLDSPGGYYQGKIAFTDDIVPYTEDYIDPQYVNSMQLDIWVQPQEKIQLQSTYISENIEAGTENEYEIKVKNVATKDITIDPTLSTYTEYYSYYEQAFGNDAIEISAPSTIKAGEIANMSIRVHVPENATGYYNGYINMNVNGKINDGYTPGVNLYFNVWQPPAPFVKTFYTTTDDPIMIEVSGDMYRSDNELRVSEKKDKLPFELGMTYNSNPINMIFVNSSESGSADIQENYNYPTWANANKKIYQNVRDHYTATYIVPGAIGEWDLSILPKGANNFQYSIKIANNNLEKTWNVTNENLVPGNSSIVNETDENASIPIDGQESEVLIADFSTNVTSGYVPLTVQFTDNSTLNKLQSTIPSTLSDEGQNNFADEPDTSDSQETSEDEYLYGIANVESIQVMTLESFPVQVHVIAEGYLPNGCPKIDEITTEREGNSFNIEISTKSPKDAMCTQAIVPFSKTIPLEVQGLKAGNYTVNVNGVMGSFELAVDNTLDESSSAIPPRQQVITEADNGTSISLKKGENFTLKLKENPGFTGYSWELNLSPGLVILSEEYENQNPPDMYDGPLTHSWIIEAVGQGDQQVNGIYKRSWESTTGTEKTFILNVTSVSSDKISRIWDFGDGSTSIEQNPAHTFTTAGIYTVSLVASNENKTATKNATINVLEQTLPPVANFNSNVTKGNAPLSVQFTDLSENATEWNWDFGDKTYSTTRDPVHTYGKAGKYTVSLTVKNKNGMDTESKNKCILVSKRK